MRQMHGLLRFLQLHWLGRLRVNAYARILALGSLVSLIWAYSQATGSGGSDFMAFWSAARLVATGPASKVYDMHSVFTVQKGLGQVGIEHTAHQELFAFVNPPPFLLVLAPLGHLSYQQALIAWSLATYLFWLGLTRRLAREFTWPIAAFPGALIAAWHAQTGFLVSGIQALVADTLERRPILAGLAIGGLIVKPHLAVLIPVALIAGRHWRSFFAAVASVAALLLLAWALFGTQTMLDYRKSWEVSHQLMTTGGPEFFLRQVTVYAALRVAWSPLAATIAQAMATLTMAWLTWRCWAAPGPMAGKVALLMAATPLATPYLFSYDLPFLAIPLCWLLREARARPGGAWERPALLLLYLSPLASRALALPWRINLMPWLLCGMVWLILRRLDGYASAARRSPTEAIPVTA